MALLNSKYLSVLGTFLLFCIPFQGVDGLSCYSCSSLENCYTSRSQIVCKASEKNCQIKFDATNAIISMNCAETCDEAATCCTGDLCNKYLNFNDINMFVVENDSSPNTPATNGDSSANTADSGSSADTNTKSTEPSSDSSSGTEKNTTASDLKSTTDSGTTTEKDTTTAKPSSNGGNLVTSAMSAMALGIAFSLLSVY